MRSSMARYRPTRANSPASGDLGVPARPSHDLPGAGAYVVSVAGVDLLESNADDKLPRLPLQVVIQFTISTRCP